MLNDAHFPLNGEGFPPLRREVGRSSIPYKINRPVVSKKCSKKNLSKNINKLVFLDF